MIGQFRSVGKVRSFCSVPLLLCPAWPGNNTDSRNTVRCSRFSEFDKTETFSFNLLRNIVHSNFEKRCRPYYPPRAQLSTQQISVLQVGKTEFQVLQKVELGSTLRNILLQLVTLKFAEWKVEHALVNTGNNSFNLQCNNVLPATSFENLPLLLGLKYATVMICYR